MELIIETTLKTAFLGNQPISVWLAGLLWSFIGIMVIKVWYLKSLKGFSLFYWLNDNTLDIVKGLVISVLLLRLEDYGLSILRDKFSMNVPDSKDLVVALIVVSAMIQIRLHKKRKPISDSLKAELKNKFGTVDPDKEETPSEKG